MQCPICGNKTKVVDTSTNGIVRLRRRRCVNCGNCIYTLETQVKSFLSTELDRWKYAPEPLHFEIQHIIIKENDNE